MIRATGKEQNSSYNEFIDSPKVIASVKSIVFKLFKVLLKTSITAKSRSCPYSEPKLAPLRFMLFGKIDRAAACGARFSGLESFNT